MLKIDAGTKRAGDPHIMGYTPKPQPMHDIGSKRAGDPSYADYTGANMPKKMKTESHPESPSAGKESKMEKKMKGMGHKESPAAKVSGKGPKKLKKLSDPKKMGMGHPGAHEA